MSAVGNAEKLPQNGTGDNDEKEDKGYKKNFHW
jgi:hypothetical protein